MTLLQPQCRGESLSACQPSPSRSLAVREDALAALLLLRSIKGLVHAGLLFKKQLSPGFGFGSEIGSRCQDSALLGCSY